MNPHPLLAIDPGSKVVGWAYFEKTRLKACGLVRAKTPTAMLMEFVLTLPRSFVSKRVVVERPQIYVRERSEGDPNDLVTIALIGGMLAGAVGDARSIDFVLPASWKGQAPKPVMGRRILKRLDEQELAIAGAAAKNKLAHNFVDAIGLGLWMEKRL